ncbi:hypothetical protein SISSUDRAFT_1047478 [Sistotremastrum suecicum HHB10207 ss-3]|uniref:Uncharacterized protein n=1 Tax=Sistotremastrum suecicum HHB10207 ss-3 TaxID=1314776 RepID=A0A166D490_9AGAM|nr:hypothetical protein SISSUDRAFT_1047478 [Sistotremastrum suecicum HHB10207 ss-3]
MATKILSPSADVPTSQNAFIPLSDQLPPSEDQSLEVVTETPAVDDESIEWIKATSNNGVPIEYGILKAQYSPQDISAFAARNANARHGGRPSANVYWPVLDGIWRNPGGASALGISRYRLFRTSGIWRYRLEITNTRGWNFHFHDQSGDYYNLDTFFNGTHYLRYNSNQPTILAVTTGST